MILDIRRADDVTDSWPLVVMILLGIGALIRHGYRLRAPIWIAFVWFLLGALLSDRGDHL